jgi:hypothetical protein
MSWRRIDGRPMNPQHIIRDGQLIIPEVMGEDEGEYECYVVNNGVETLAAVSCRLEVLGKMSHILILRI